MKHRTEAKFYKLLDALPKAIQTKHEDMKMSMPAKKSAQIKSAQAKSARVARKKSAARESAMPAEEEEDEFDRALARALEAGAFDEMIAQADQAYRDGKTKPLSHLYKKYGSG